MEFVEIKPKSYPSHLVKKDWEQRKCFYRQGGEEFMERLHDMEVLDDDVWIVTLPKCGTTWMQELVWLVMHDFDFETAKNVNLEERTPFLEFDFMVYNNLKTAFLPIEKLKSPRFIKSHLPMPLLPEQLWTNKPKLIYVFRNPKDALVSSYYHMRSLGFAADTTLDRFITAVVEFDPMKEMHFEHVTEFYAIRDEPWVFYTSFERMKKDLRQVITDICKFLNKSITEEQMTKMLHHLSFEEMKNNPKTNHHWEFQQVRRKFNSSYEAHNFVRKGQVGGYKEELSPETIQLLDSWIQKQTAAYNVTMDELLLLNCSQDTKL